MFLLSTFALIMASASASAMPASTDATVEVELKLGKMEGVRESIGDSRFYYSFKGVPYAQPPVGDLRFKDPVPVAKWSDVRNSVTPPPCPQPVVDLTLIEGKEVIGEEDCLYLNLYTPKPDKSANLPVMAFMHGGSFKWGNADNMGGTPHRMLKKDIILISIQSRLGTLGFLSTGDSALPGNYGLKDQTLALKWINENIKHFGGDPERVTIFGESAGAIGVHLQMFIPTAEGLFNGAILQSGTALSALGLRDDHAEIAANIGKDFKCPGADKAPLDGTQLLSCLKEASVEKLVRATEPYAPMGIPLFMEPRIDGEYLPAHPAQLLTEGKYYKVNIMTGNCQNEATTPVKGLMITNKTADEGFMQYYVTSLLPLLMGFGAENNTQYLTQRLYYNSMKEMKVTEDNVDDFEKFITEGYMLINQDEAAGAHGRDAIFGKSVYRYELQHRGERSFADWANTTFGINWVAHMDDLQYLFDGVFDYPPVQRADDLLLSDIMVTLWTNFAETGNPTPDLELGFKWDPMKSSTDFSYLSLTPAPKMREDNRAESRDFWRNLPLKRNKMMFPDLFL